MRCVMVSHTHWDREWYKTFQSFRARLVDTIDRVLALLAEDPGYSFQLDGQAIVVEDYLAIRPERRSELEAAVAAGRIAIGPWYVQPDSLIPTGETHIRNLLEGRRVAAATGGGSTIAYTPDSFGHPAQFPQIFAGFGLGPFIYWRGNSDEIAELPAEYDWRAPDGSVVLACHLARGYFSAWGLPDAREPLLARLEPLAKALAERSESGVLLLMNGMDHMLPDDNTQAACAALAEATGWQVERGLLGDFVDALEAAQGGDLAGARPVFAGELLGGRVANLLPGVWSTHSELKRANRRCESALTGWLEPFASIGRMLGAPDESASLRMAWRALLPNQAHDSICGCSQDRVHEQMAARYDDTIDLVDETLDRLLERVAGLGAERQVIAEGDDAKSDGFEIAVFNPSPHPRTDRVRVPLSGFPAFTKRGVATLLALNYGIEGFEQDGVPVRVIPDRGTVRPLLAPDQPVHDLELVVRDVPALGWRRLRVTPSGPHPDTLDEGREIEAEGIRVCASEDGLLDVHWPGESFRGLCALEDLGDRGDSYDFDPVAGPAPELLAVAIQRRRHASGIQSLRIERTLGIPAQLDESRAARSDRRCELRVVVEATLAPGAGRVDLDVRVDNTARDHRLRLLFPSGAPCASFAARTTLDVTRRSTELRDGSEWIHPAPATFPQQGFVQVGGLVVAAPGLLEAEVTPEGVLALTLLRSVGWLSRPDLTTRPGAAGPSLPTPGAQCPGQHRCRISLLAPPAGAGAAPAAASVSIANAARDAELGLRACAAGPAALGPADAALLEVKPGEVVLSALKPAEDGAGTILRLLNPTDTAVEARIRLAPALLARIDEIRSVALDETGPREAVLRDGADILVPLRPHGLATLRLRHASRKETDCPS
jgi:alpha-mannosidase